MTCRPARQREVEAAADRAQHLAVLPPQLGGVTVVVSLVHRRCGMRCRARCACIGIGEIVLLDQALEALQLRDVLVCRHPDEPARQCRLDQHADLGDVADEILVDRPHARAAVAVKRPRSLRRAESAAPRAPDLSRCHGAGEVGGDQPLVGSEPALDDVLADEFVDGGAFALEAPIGSIQPAAWL